MDSNEQKETRVVHHDHGETRGWVADAAPIAAVILAGGQIIAAKISANGKDKGGGDGKS